MSKSEFNLVAIEKKAVIAALRFFEGNRTKTAKALGVNVRTLRNKINRYGMKGYLKRGGPKT